MAVDENERIGKYVRIIKRVDGSSTVVVQGRTSAAFLDRKHIPDLIQQLCKLPPHPALENKQPVVLYFDNDEDREEFIAAMLQVKPNMKCIKP